MSRLSKTKKIKTPPLYKPQIFVSLGAFLLLTVLIGLSSREIPKGELPEDISKIQDPKTALGVFYVTRTSQPMEGVSMLKASIEDNPNNKEAHWYLGQFSVRSGQYDKAVVHFENLLSVETDPSERFKTYIYLEDAKMSSGDVEGALEILIKMKQEFGQDEEISQLIDERIEYIKKNINALKE